MARSHLVALTRTLVANPGADIETAYDPVSQSNRGDKKGCAVEKYSLITVRMLKPSWSKVELIVLKCRLLLVERLLGRIQEPRIDGLLLAG